MKFKTLAWLVLLVPTFFGVGVYAFLVEMVGVLPAMIGGLLMALFLLLVFIKNLGMPIE